MDIFALIFVCSISGECIEIRDRIGAYRSVAECKLDIVNLQKSYKTNMITCHNGDILEEEYEKPKGA